MTRGHITIDLVGVELEPFRWRWDERDAMLYALGVGAAPDRDLDFIYEGGGLSILPTFAAVPVGLRFRELVEWLGVDLSTVLHAGQSLRLEGPLGPSGELTVRRRIAEVWDKGSGAIVVVEDRASSFTARSSWWIGGAGAFRGERGPTAAAATHPERVPDFSFARRVPPAAAALHRLSGDYNPIHIDPAYAQEAGFERPILHGLCTLGSVVLDLIAELWPGRPSLLSRIEARFAGPVLPGDQLRTEGWWTGPGTVSCRTLVDGRPVLDQEIEAFQH